MIAATQQVLSMRRLVTRALPVLALSGAMLVAAAADSSAQVVKRAVQGGLLGAGVGAIAGGGKGAGKGAAIGAGIGAVVGASERANAERRYNSPPPRYTSAPPPPRPAYNDPLVYDIQTSLSRLGYDPGPLDGVYGQRTADAIRAYEYNNRLPLTGEPSPQLRDHLYEHGG